MKKKTIIITTAVIIISLITIKLIANKSTIEAKKEFKGSIDSRVNVVCVAKKLQGNILSLTGVTVAKQEVILKSEASGQIVALNINLGEYVPKGKVLVEIDDRLAQLSLETAKLNLSRAEDEYNKTVNLFAGKATTETKVRDTKIDFERAKINYEQALKQLSFTKIIATQNGYIVSKQVDRGAYVSNNSPILSLVDISQLKVAIKAAEKDVYNLKLGQSVKISSSVYPDVIYSGKVSFVSQQGDAYHNYPVEILIDNKDSYQLKAGTFVNVDFNLSSGQPKLMIPREALVGSIKNAKVFTVTNNIASERSIQIGKDFGNYLEVVSGLKEGDIIVTSGQINITNGSTVSILK